jgi:hypothetical protein
VRPINFVAVTSWAERTPDLQVQFAVEAVRKELPDFCRCWGLPIPGIGFFSRGVELALSEAIIVSGVDDDGQVGTLGYHTVAAGVPLMLWECQYGTPVFAHEVFETLVDPDLSRWALAPDGREWWVEACDATEGDSYPVDVEVAGQFSSTMVSNWLAPAYFGLPNADGSVRFDKMGLVSAPFTLRPGGYSIVMVGGERQQIGAARPAKGISTSRTKALAARPPQSSR